MKSTINEFPRKVGRIKTRDTGDAITFRMPAGFPGDVARFPGSTIEPCQLSPNSAPVSPGLAVVADFAAGNNMVRLVQPGDVAANTPIYGFVVRVFPFQQTTGGMAASFGTGVYSGPIVDVLRRGYMITTANVASGALKGAPVFVWAAASAGNHVQGGVETAASAGNTIALDNKSTFNGPGDSYGNTEFTFNI